MAYIVRIGSQTTAEESALGPFTTRAAATTFRDKIQARIDALADNSAGVWTAVTPLERPALAKAVRQWGLRRPDDTLIL